ncbi:DUF4255 domain-containing protein [Deinococcus arcticus]|uniref:DUF4255 domain-containing protein n=1 Tax=Deinococcus arcticus TaxID=2136176 RepID=A0A2T3W5J1_9DEIO|nr:DUF4255 domain-containing protein [Deinococcus arcticus]PTA67166.1 DUF4255 domain-containing protein [Deinococcus arcticus]
MIADVQQALKELVYTEAALPREALDIRFAAPTPSWVSGLTRPTLNFFMHDLRENAGLRSMEFSQAPVRGGVQRTLAARRIDLRFLVTVFFKSQLDELGRDEWNVLWRVLAALMRQNEWGETYLPEEARRLNLGVLGVVGPGEGTQSVFSSLGQPVRPHLNYTVTVPLDLNVTAQSPLVLERDLAFYDGLTRDMPAVSTRVRSSWQLRDEAGVPLSDALVRTDGGARGFTDVQGVVHLNVPRDAVARLDILTLDGRQLSLQPHSPQAQPRVLEDA